MDHEFESSSCVFLLDPASRKTNETNQQGFHVSVASERKANGKSQPISGIFSFLNAVNSPTVVHLEKLCVSVSQSTSKILSRHPFSQMNHLLEPPQFAVMCKATSLPPPPNPKRCALHLERNQGI